MAEDRYAAEGYKIIQSVEIAGTEIVIADNPQADRTVEQIMRTIQIKPKK